MNSKQRKISIIVLICLLIIFCTYELIQYTGDKEIKEPKNTDENIITENNQINTDYILINDDDIREYLDDDCKETFNHGGEPYNSYRQLSLIGVYPTITDINGNELDLSGKTLLYFHLDVGCNSIKGEIVDLFESIINNYGYKVYQIFLSEEDRNEYYKNVNKKPKKIEGLQEIIVDEDELKNLDLSNAEEVLFVQNGRIVLKRAEGIRDLNTFDYATTTLIDKIDSCKTLQTSLKAYETDHSDVFVPEIPAKDDTALKEVVYSNEVFKDVIEVEKNEEIIIGLYIKELVGSKVEINKDYFDSGIRDILDSLTVSELLINQKPVGNIYSEDENSNVYLKLAISEKNTTVPEEKSDGGVSGLFLNINGTPQRIIFENWVRLKLKD